MPDFPDTPKSSRTGTNAPAVQKNASILPSFEEFRMIYACQRNDFTIFHNQIIYLIKAQKYLR